MMSTAAQLDATTAGTAVTKKTRITPNVLFKQYVEFICFVESTYLHNLTIEMITVCAHGNLINVIKNYLMDNKDIMVKFTTLCNNDSAYNKIECQDLLRYILERYANMRGTYSAKHLKRYR